MEPMRGHAVGINMRMVKTLTQASRDSKQTELGSLEKGTFQAHTSGSRKGEGALQRGQFEAELHLKYVQRTSTCKVTCLRMTTALSPALSHVHDHPVFGIHILPNQILKHNEGFHEEILWRTVEEGFGKQAHS